MEKICFQKALYLNSLELGLVHDSSDMKAWVQFLRPIELRFMIL